MIYSNSCLVGDFCICRPVKHEDAEFIVLLRQQNPRSTFFSRTSCSVEEQVKWLNEYDKRHALGEDYYFIVEQEGGQRVGTTRVYKIDGLECTIGSWALMPNTLLYISLESYFAPLFFAFEELRLEQANLDVRRFNRTVWKWHESCGARFIKEDSLDRFYFYDTDAYKKAHRRVYELTAK